MIDVKGGIYAPRLPGEAGWVRERRLPSQPNSRSWGRGCVVRWVSGTLLDEGIHSIANVLCLSELVVYCFNRIYASHYPPSILSPFTKHTSKYPLTTPELNPSFLLSTPPSIPLHYFFLPTLSTRKRETQFSKDGFRDDGAAGCPRP